MNNEEQIILMLEKMNQKIDSLETNQEKIFLTLRKMDKKIDTLETRADFVQTTVARIEIEHGEKLQALIDGQVAIEEKLADHEPRIVKLEHKTDRHDVDIAQLRRKAK